MPVISPGPINILRERVSNSLIEVNLAQYHGAVSGHRARRYFLGKASLMKLRISPVFQGGPRVFTHMVRFADGGSETNFEI